VVLRREHRGAREYTPCWKASRHTRISDWPRRSTGLRGVPTDGVSRFDHPKITWGQKTAAELIARFQVTAGDKFFQFQGMNEDTTVNITAYVLQVNGAKAGTQPLTDTTGAVVNSLVQ
jgi:hypothetical protein